MFNTHLKKEAILLREKEIEQYNYLYTEFLNRCGGLYEIRCKGVDVVTKIQNLINSIAKTPKDFETTLERVQKEKLEFKQTEQYAEENKQNMAKAGAGIVAGVGIGTTVATMAPTAAMGIATTFGTASTGTAISALSGAVQTKAALAWLGSGALAKGGAGVVGGKALLALAGPVGWGIAATAVGVSLYALCKSNENTSKQITEETEVIKKRCLELESIIKEVELLYQETEKLYQLLLQSYESLQQYENRNYKWLSWKVHKQLGTLVNNTWTMAQKINYVLS